MTCDLAALGPGVEPCVSSPSGSMASPCLQQQSSPAAPPSFMTQAKRTSGKRAGETPAAAEQGKKLRCAISAAATPLNAGREQVEDGLVCDEEVACAHGVGSSGVAEPEVAACPSLVGSMAGVLAPLLSVFSHRGNHGGQHTTQIADCNRLAGEQGQTDSDDSGDSTNDENAAAHNEVAQQHLAVLVQQQRQHCAHHPAPPEVPEAAESDLDEEEDAQDVVCEFDPLLFIKMLPPLHTVVPPFRTTLLPRRTRTCKQKTLVLDLDETLVHSTLEAVGHYDFAFAVHFNSQDHQIHVRKRPHLEVFMERVSQLFEIVVFTASQKIYAEKLLNIIDPSRTLIKHRIFRDSCVVVDGNYLKDLTVLGRDLRDTIIIDNSPQAFGFQIDNGVPIESWYDDDCDEELLKLLPFLEGLVDVDDVRPCISQKFRLRELVARAAI